MPRLEMTGHSPLIAITGGTGFAGRSLVEAIRQAIPDARLRLLVRQPGVRRLPEALLPHDLIAGDLDSRRALAELVDGSDVVIHLAAALAGSTEADFDHSNITGTRHLIDAIEAGAPLSHLIHVSSLAAARPELSWYAASKRAAEEMVAGRVRNHSILRPPAVYGPDDPALTDFWRLLARGWLLRLGPADARFSLLHANDLAGALVALVRHGATGTVMPVAGPQPENGWTWQELAEVASTVRRQNIRVIPIPAWSLRTLARINILQCRLLGRRAMLSPGKARELLHRDWVCDNRQLRRAVDWQPATSLAQALGNLPGWSLQ